MALVPRLHSWAGRHERILLLGLLGFALLIRIAVALPALSINQGFRMGDDNDYHTYAANLVTHGRYEDGIYRAYRMPLFPIFLAGLYLVVGVDPVRAQLILPLLGVLNVGLAFLLGQRIGGKAIGWLAAVIVTFDPAQVRYSGVLMTETLCVTLLTGSMLALMALQARGGYWRALCAGALFGLLVLTRVNMIIVVPFACAWLLRWGRGSFRSRIAICLVVAGVCGLFWGAWVVRNYQVFGKLMPMSTGGGGVYYGIYNDEAAQWQSLSHYGQWRRRSLPPEIRGFGELERDQWQREVTWNWITSHKQSALLIWLAQPFHYWRSSLGNPFPPVLLIFALFGMHVLRRQQDPAGALWGLVFLALTLMTLVTLGLPRFNIPLMPGLAALAGIGMIYVWRELQQFWVSKKIANA